MGQSLMLKLNILEAREDAKIAMSSTTLYILLSSWFSSSASPKDRGRSSEMNPSL